MTGPDQPARSATAALRNLLGRFHAEMTGGSARRVRYVHAEMTGGSARRVRYVARLDPSDIGARLTEVAALERGESDSALEQTARHLGRAEAQRDRALSLLTEIVADLERGVTPDLARVNDELESITGPGEQR